MSNPERQVEVAIIGGGLSGLVAAYRLVQAGRRSVAVFEARDRVGGRTLNHSIASGQFVECGGQWVGPTQKRVLALANELGVARFRTPTRGRNLIFLGEERHAYRGAMPAAKWRVMLDFLFAAARLQLAAWRVSRESPWTAREAHRLDHTTLQEWIDEHTSTPGARALFRIVSGLTLGGNPAELSLLGVLQHIRSVGGLPQLLSIRGGAQDSRLVGGAQVLSLRLAERLEGHVLTSTKIDRIEWDTSGATLWHGGISTRARRVVVAMSPPDRRRIQFTPDLPPAQQMLAAQMGMFTGFKVNVVYDRPFWRDEGLSGHVLSDTGIAPITFDNSPPGDGPGILVAFVAGQPGDDPLLPSSHHVNDALARKEAVLACFARYFGEQARQPIDYIEKDWRSDELSAGCIPTIPPGLLTELGPHLEATTGPIIWSGAESAHVWNGYMDGAVRAGERAAELALA